MRCLIALVALTTLCLAVSQSLGEVVHPGARPGGPGGPGGPGAGDPDNPEPPIPPTPPGPDEPDECRYEYAGPGDPPGGAAGLGRSATDPVVELVDPDQGSVSERATDLAIGSAGLRPAQWRHLRTFDQRSSGPGDTQFFGGGNVATSSLTQTVGLSAPSAAGVTYNLSADLGGWLINPGAASVSVDFLDANKLYLGSASIGPVSLFDRLFQTTLLNRSTTGNLPTGTQYAQVTVNLKAWNPILPGLNPDYNSAFADNVSLTVSDPALAVPQTLTPPVSTVGALDHVFMVYMENKGYDDIVGSPNAPFLNSLINNFGFADNYYALTHGSLPNYYPMLGGTDFNITYNCKTACIDDSATSTLFSNIDAAGKTWRSYAQSLEPGASPLVSSGEYAFDETAFPAFSSIYNNPTYAAAHILPLEQMAIDLQSNATAPNYAWFAADENFAGEGPTTFPVGTLKFLFNQIDPHHQYNVPAIDEYLSTYIPVITNSNVWQDPTQKSIVVVTFDEDNNNLSLGFGNEGNHIVTVVIPSPGAIAAGMKSGSVVDSTHYDHYSLLRTIEEALGLPSLTNNDKYAVPMNGFWGTGAGAGAGTLV